MSLVNYFIIFSQVKTIKTFYNFTCCVREHRCFIVITISMKRIYAEIFPHLAINGILFCKEREEINQEYNRFSRNVPTTYTNFQAVVLQSTFTPCYEHIARFNKKRIFFTSPKIRTDKEKLITVHIMQCLCTCRQYCIYTSDLVANFPTRLEDIIWS